MLFLRRRHAPRLPAGLTAHLPAGRRVLASVPVAGDGGRWAVATLTHLTVMEADGVVTDEPWNAVEHGSWDASERCFTLRWAQESRPPLVLRVPQNLEGDAGRKGTGQEVDVAPFARALRQRVEATIVHTATQVLPSGLRATASVRLSPTGDLYMVTSPTEPAGLPEPDRQALARLRQRVGDGVGLPTG
ncbi:hypothetical protein [Actinomyces oricola]|uniref:hypothetical protein n=1 Tax=Actinomyces oricola TaxID=206043 RepID=UPI001F4FDA05|nr:hypothetical protein [Actinomyces oricola]